MFSSPRRSSRTVPRPARPRPTFRPRLETLEDRTAPAMLLVTSLADDGGAGTLRSLIAVAQTNGDASNTIDFDPSLAGGVITLTAAPLNPATGTFPGPTAFDVNKTLTILGGGQTITRAATAADFRFFFVEATGSLTLSNLTLSGGLAKGFDSGGTGGGAAGLGGAIFNMGTLTVQGVTFTGDAAVGGNSGGSASNGGAGLGSGAGANGGNPNGGAGGISGAFAGSGGGGGFGGGGGGGGFGIAGDSTATDLLGASGGSGGAGGFGGGGGGGGFGSPGGSGRGGFGGGGGAGGFGGGGGAGAGDANVVAGSGQGGSGGFGGGAGPGGGAGMGGAIFSEQGSVTITNSILTGNSAVGGAGGPGGGGGSGFGGAVFILSGTLTLSGSTFSGNTITAGGGSPAGAAVGPDGYNAVTGQAFTSLTPQEQFVQALYLDVLGRTGSKAELDGWVVLFNSGFSQTDDQAAIAAGIETSPEGRDHLVKGWYETFLGRSAVGGEEQGWVNQLLAGAPEEQVLSAILATPEFYSRAQTLGGSGTPDQNYVQALYQRLLGRAGSDAEVTGWINVLPQLGRQGVAVRFLVSGEYRTDLVQSYYELLLHRPADTQGLDGWVSSGLGELGVRVGIEASAEFFTNG